jgi:hypothetical protein
MLGDSDLSPWVELSRAGEDDAASRRCRGVGEDGFDVRGSSVLTIDVACVGRGPFASGESVSGEPASLIGVMKERGWIGRAPSSQSYATFRPSLHTPKLAGCFKVDCEGRDINF